MRRDEAELARKRYLYRRLIVTGQVALPLSAAAGLIGPDCAYHLYAALGTRRSRRRPATRKARTVSRHEGSL